MARLTRRRRQSGFTLVELIVTTVILGVMLSASIAVYVAAQRFFDALLDNDERIFAPALAMESMLRRAHLANGFEFDGGNQTIKFRVDPNLTPSDFTDDQWVKYRIIGNRLRWKTEAAQAGIVTGADPEVEPGLVLEGGSAFAVQNPTGAGLDVVIDITLVTRIGSPPVDTTLTAAAAIGALAKN